jgi:hypothetical protein
MVGEEHRDQIVEMVSEMENRLEEAKQAEVEAVHQKMEEKQAALKAEYDAGYAEAFEAISDLRHRLDTIQEEHQLHMVEEFGEAFKMVKEAENKANQKERELREEYEGRFQSSNTFVIDRLAEYLATKGDQMMELARRETLNDPTVAEHRVALNKILDVASNYLVEGQVAAVAKSKQEELHKAVEDLRGQVRILENRNVRLTNENVKLNEVARQAKNVLTESTRVERESRKELSKKATGRGDIVNSGTKVITEADENLPETTKGNLEVKKWFSDMKKLSGQS